VAPGPGAHAAEAAQGRARWCGRGSRNGRHRARWLPGGVCQRDLRASADAAVLFTSSGVGKRGRAYWGAYGASKAGLLALAATLADECEGRDHVRVNAIVPGPIRSPLRMLTHPGEDRRALPVPEALVPLYLHVLGAQTKAESGVRIDAHAWLAGQPASTPLVTASVGARP